MPTTGAEPCPFLFETERLLFRRPELSDAPVIHTLVGDADVARFTANIPHPYPPGAAETWIASLSDEVEMVRLAVRRSDGTVVGCMGIRTRPDRGEADLGYWIGKPFWNQGYATEVVRGAINLAFEHFPVDRVTASAMPANRASIRVQEKSGLSLVGTGTEEAPAREGPITVEIRAITRAVWRASAPTVLVAAVALIDADGRVLLAERPAGKSMAGLWEFPGGKVAQGETPEAALIRELKEELGIDTTASCLAPFTFASHRYAAFHLLMPLYLCRKWKGIVAPMEGQRLAWVRVENLSDYPMPPADVPLVAMLRDLL